MTPPRRERCTTASNDEALLAAALTGFSWSSVGLVEYLGGAQKCTDH